MWLMLEATVMANNPNPSLMAQCGCGMVGEKGKLGKGLSLIRDSNDDRTHELVDWWCKDCQRAEWRCEDTGKGRFCDVNE
jgi:hypothetical protein